MKKTLVISIVVLFFSVSVFIVMRTMTETFIDSSSSVAPYVKALQNDPKISVFGDNPCNKGCCLNGRSSGYSCDRGCVCITDDQMKLFQTRGGNRSAGSEY